MQWYIRGNIMEVDSRRLNKDSSVLGTTLDTKYEVTNSRNSTKFSAIMNNPPHSFLAGVITMLACGGHIVIIFFFFPLT